MRGVFVRAGVVVGLTVLTGVPATADERPLPVERSTILRDEGVTYFVEGRRRIARGTEITLQKGTRLVGRGEDAVLEVEGTLVVRGVNGQRVEVEDLVIELAQTFEEVRFDNADIRRGAVRGPEGVALNGDLHFLTSSLGLAGGLDLRFEDGFMRLLNANFGGPVRIRAVVPEGKNKTEFGTTIIGSGFTSGLFLTGVPDATVRTNRLHGDATEFVDCKKLMFDANLVSSKSLALRWTKPGGFKGTKVQKCDFECESITLHAPRDGKKKERVPFDKCWFGGKADDRDILGPFLKDGHSEESNGAFAKFGKISKKRVGLAGYGTPR